jgi:hypothetical protein
MKAAQHRRHAGKANYLMERMEQHGNKITTSQLNQFGVKARWSRAVAGFESRKMSYYQQRRMGITAAVGWMMVVPNGDFLGGLFYT